MKDNKKSILILYTTESKRTDFENTIEFIKEEYGFSCEIHDNFKAIKAALGEKSEDKFEVILIHILSSQKDGEKLWRDVYYEAKVNNKFTEVIVIVSGNEKNPSIKAKDVLGSGCFAFFQYPYETDVLLGYILAAQEKSKERRYRVNLSQALNNAKDLDSVIHVIAEQLKELTKADDVMVARLKESTNKQGYLPKILYPKNIDSKKLKKLTKPTSQDPLIDNILEGRVRKKIFTHPQSDPEILQFWNARKRDNNIQSWIALPLYRMDKLIGLITIDSYSKNHFSYENINEATLEQFANQAATSIRLAEEKDASIKLEDALKAINGSTSYEETLQKLAREAYHLAGALFSYIVTPNEKKDWLNFDAAWSRDHDEKYISELRRRVTSKNNTTNKYEPGFPLLGEESEGITTEAYYKKETQLLNCISANDYDYIEEYPEVRNKYYEFTYRFTDINGNSHVLMPQSDIAIPIIGFSNEVLGVINVEHELPFAFTKEHIKVLKRLAEFAAIVIDKEHRAKKEEKEKQLLKALINSNDFIINYDEAIRLDHNTPTKRIQEFLNDLAKQVLNISKANYVSVFSVKDNISFCVGRSTNLIDKITITNGARTDTPENYGHTFWCIKNKAKVVIEDTDWYEKNIESFIDKFGNQYKRKENNSFIHINTNVDKSIQSLVCIPMMGTNGNAVGVIWMHHQSNPAYNEDELDYFQKYANKAANALLLAEAITFKDIELSIGQHQNKDDVLSETVNLAKNFFGIEGVSIYEADSYSEELTRVKTTIPEIFPRNVKIKYREGLAGRLIYGKDLGSYKYSEGYIYIPDYQKYDHPLENLTPRQKEKLGSVVGIRLPYDVPCEEAVGVLVFFEELTKGRTYEASKEKLIRLANFAGRHLQRIRNTENASKEKRTDNTPPHTPPSSSPSTTIYQIGHNYALTASGQGNNIDITNQSKIKNGLTETEVKGLFETIIRQIETTAGTKSRKNEIEVTVELIQEEILKGEKAEEKALTSFFRTLKNMAPDILDVVIAAATNPLLAASVIAKKVAEKIKSEP